MRNIKLVLLIVLVVFIFAGCHRDLGLDGPSGTYLYLNLTFPENDNADGGRFIHSEADELTVSLTYPGKTAIEVFFELTSTSPGSILVEDLETGSDVLLQVSVGMADSDILLSTASTTLDIVSGANSPVSLTLQGIDYTVYGTLYDDADQILADHTFTHNGANVLTDSSGQFTLTLTTSDFMTSDYATFEIINTDTYELARTNLYLLQNRADFSLKASPEIYLDFIVGCEQYVLPGTTYRVLEGGEIERATGTADSNGRIFYQNSNYDSSAGHEIELSFNDMFVTKYIYTDGAPGAEVDDVVIDPYIIYSNSDYTFGVKNLHRIQDMTGSGLNTIAIGSGGIISDYSSDIAGVPLILNYTVDYLKNQIYLFVTYRDTPGVQHWKILKMTGWNSAIQELSVDSVFAYDSGGAFSVPQMLVKNDGNLFVSTTRGGYTVNTTSMSIDNIWEINNLYGFVCNGAYQDDDGAIIILGADRFTGSVDADKEKQRIWRLGASGGVDWTLSADLPSAYSIFAGLNSSVGTSEFTYLKSLFSWNSKIISVQTHTGSSTEGKIVFFTAQSGLWDSYGSPEEDRPDGGTFYYVRPLGVLPDNKFYFFDDRGDSTGVMDRIMQMDSLEDSSLQFYEFYNNPSSPVVQDYYNYDEGT